MQFKPTAAFLFAGLFALSACQGGEGDGTADVANVVCVGEATTYLDWLEGGLNISEADPIEEPASENPDDLLAQIQEAGVIRVSTDPNYAPQSFLNPDGSYEGFDIDVATEIAERLGVEVQFETPDWDAITAGSWSERWDISVGSMTITDERKEALSFTRPYYYTPAQMAVASDVGVDSLEALPFDLPDGAEATTLPTDANCAEAIRAGREDFQLWLSSATTVQQAIDDGIPVEAIGEPVFAEPLSVALDQSGPPHEALLYEIDSIIAEMHEDGTLAELSDKWYGLDLTAGAD